MWKALLAILFSMADTDNPIYRKVGDSVVLTPVNPGAPISFIAWIHRSNIAVEWFNGVLFPSCHFKGRCEVNNQTGALTIMGLTGNDSGRYEAEINHNTSSKPTWLRVVAPVSKPTISSRCDPEMTYCLLTCEGNTMGAEPITYRWLPGGGVVKPTKVLPITKEDRELSFSCQVENPVSLQISDPMPNPLVVYFAGNWMSTIICLISLAVGGILLLYVRFCKKREPSRDEGCPSHFRPVSAVDEEASHSEV